MKQGFAIDSDETRLLVSQGLFHVRFDQTIKAGTGFLLTVKIVPNAMDEVASVTLNKGKTMKYKELHAMLGHPGEKTVRETAKHLSIEVNGKMKNPCEHCAKAEIQQKNIPKENKSKTDVVGEQLYVDISREAMVTTNSGVWLLMK
jgi:hypothetical protein